MEYDIDDPIPYVRTPLIEQDWWIRTAEYRTVFRLTFPTQVFWLVIYLFLFLVVAPKVYGHEILEGQGVVCDSQAQIEMFADLGSELNAVTAINAETPHACAMAQVAYIRGQTIKQVHSGKATVDVVEILVLAFFMRGQWISIEPASIQYTLFPVTEEGA